MSNAQQRDRAENLTRGQLCSDQAMRDLVRSEIVPIVSAFSPGGSPYAPLQADYGVLTDIALTTGFYAYDHPALLGICDTAFTDGVNVYFAAPFLRELVKEERKVREPGQRVYSVLPIVLHELYHKAREHLCVSTRFRGESAELVYNAQERSINASIHLQYGDRYAWGPTFARAWGMDDPQRWGNASEEQIVAWLKEARAKGGQLPSPQTSLDGSSRTHTVTLKQLIQALEAHPDGAELIEKLGLPSSTNDRAIKGLEREAERNVRSAINAARERSRNGSPGGHIESYLYREMQRKNEAVLDWKILLRQAMISGSGRTRHTMDMAGPLYGVDVRPIGMSTKLWLGDREPQSSRDAFVFVIDTSGSVDDELLGQFFDEAVGIMRQHPTKVGTLLVYCADTVVRDQPIILTQSNWRAVAASMKPKGGGGTDMAQPLADLFADGKPLLGRYRISGCCVFSDMQIPQIDRKTLPTKLPPTFFVGPASMSIANAQALVGDWAPVIPLQRGSVVDFTKTPDARAVALR